MKYKEQHSFDQHVEYPRKGKFSETIVKPLDGISINWHPGVTISAAHGFVVEKESPHCLRLEVQGMTPQQRRTQHHVGNWMYLVIVLWIVYNSNNILPFCMNLGFPIWITYSYNFTDISKIFPNC